MTLTFVKLSWKLTRRQKCMAVTRRIMGDPLWLIARVYRVTPVAIHNLCRRYGYDELNVRPEVQLTRKVVHVRLQRIRAAPCP